MRRALAWVPRSRLDTAEMLEGKAYQGKCSLVARVRHSLCAGESPSGDYGWEPPCVDSCLNVLQALGALQGCAAWLCSSPLQGGNLHVRDFLWGGGGVRNQRHRRR